MRVERPTVDRPYPRGLRCLIPSAGRASGRPTCNSSGSRTSTARCGAEENIWQFRQPDSRALERVLALYDWQLQHASVKTLLERRLTRFAQSDKTLPWQDIDA
jgi:hypothetical protein